MPTVVKPIHPATTSQPPSTPSWSPVVRRRYRVRASVRMMTCRSGNTRNKPLFRRSAHPPASSVMRAPPVEYVGSERACPPCLSLDRKSVVHGQSVSVAVDLGGRRIFQKKKSTKDTHDN